MTKQSHYNVGIYVRLSQEDERAGESISIENQKKMLTEYVSQQTDWSLVEICEDDGYSGTDFNRPGVQKLLADAKSGKINLILCKDLSRFGRNYIEVGQYIDYIFPSFNIRFIALSDNVDTLERNSTAMDIRGLVRCEGLVIFTDTDKLSVKFKKLLLERRLNVMYLYSRCGNRIGGFEISITVVDADYVCVVKSDHRVPPFWSAMPFY